MGVERRVSFQTEEDYHKLLHQRSYHYFTNPTFSKKALYFLVASYVATVSFLSIAQPFLDLCDKDAPRTDLDFSNPGYDQRICVRTRSPKLLYLTPEECSFGRRIVIAGCLGALVGWERRNADRPAGIRTMSLVSLGSCLFAICSSFAFIEGPMEWDGSRVAAAIPSGVGFLGSAVIWKQSHEEGQSVHGLSTATAVWVAAACGIACAGELYVAASFTVAVMMLILRFGPRIEDDPENETEFISEHAVMDELTFDEENAEPMSPLRLPSVGYGSTKDLSGKSASMRRSTHSHFSRSAHVRASLKD